MSSLNERPTTDFWKSSGFHLVRRNANGWLEVTPEFLRAYYARPEIHPVEDSCAAEIALYERLMADPFLAVSTSDLDALADADTADNYRVVLRFRDHLAAHGTLEAAYAALFAGGPIAIPPVFIDQMVHLILRNILDAETDPITLRAAELFFREQIATIGEDRLMLADAEMVEIPPKAASAVPSFEHSPAAARARLSLDVLTPETADEYWARSDRFDTALDFRFTQPGSDALATVMSRWIRHFLGVDTRIQSMASIRDRPGPGISASTPRRPGSSTRSMPARPPTRRRSPRSSASTGSNSSRRPTRWTGSGASRYIWDLRSPPTGIWWSSRRTC